MRVLNADEFNQEKEQLTSRIIDGAVFIYPTDTIYGIGCNAQNPSSVKKIRIIKGRASSPFSVIAPSLEWIYENCAVTKEAEDWAEKLPGPYTLIFRLKNKSCIAKEVNPGLNTLGVRMPNHWIRKIVAEAEVPVVTTSVNKSGSDYMTSLENLDESIKGSTDFIIYEGEKKEKPSRIVDLTKKPMVIER